MDLIGPWRVTVNEIELEFKALTCIDPVTNLAEAIRINNKTSRHIADQFRNCWLSRYPKPNKCIHDNGGEFIGAPFLGLLRSAGIQSRPTTVKNPQANAICERLHLTMGNILRVITQTNPPTDEEEADQVIDNALATCIHVTRAAINQTMQTSPGAFVFQRDMLFDIPVQSDMQAIRNKRQLQIDNNLIRSNKRRLTYNYQPGQQVMVLTEDPTKLQQRTHGPYIINKAFTNGTVELQLNATNATIVNIRKLVPMKQQLLRA